MEDPRIETSVIVPTPLSAADGFAAAPSRLKALPVGRSHLPTTPPLTDGEGRNLNLQTTVLSAWPSALMHLCRVTQGIGLSLELQTVLPTARNARVVDAALRTFPWAFARRTSPLLPATCGVRLGDDGIPNTVMK